MLWDNVLLSKGTGEGYTKILVSPERLGKSSLRVTLKLKAQECFKEEEEKNKNKSKQQQQK